MKDGYIVKINQLNFAVVAESLKSGKGGMDKNTYKALKTDKNQRITYKMNKVNNIDCTSTSDCKISTSGFLWHSAAGGKSSYNRRRKEDQNRKKVTSFAVGSPQLYDFINDNPIVHFKEAAYTNDTAIIRQKLKLPQ